MHHEFFFIRFLQEEPTKEVVPSQTVVDCLCPETDTSRDRKVEPPPCRQHPTWQAGTGMPLLAGDPMNTILLLLHISIEIIKMKSTFALVHRD